MRMTISTTPGSSVDRGDTVKISLVVGARPTIEETIAADSASSRSGLSFNRKSRGKA
jgi:hypothetical protein